MGNKLKIIVADDHPLLNQGLLYVLSKKENYEIVGNANEGNSALELIRNLKPDIAILDVRMPNIDGFEIAKIAFKENIPTKIIFLTMFKEEEFVKKVIEFGVRGYVLKENAITDIVNCIEAVNEGKLFLSPQISEILLSADSINELDVLTTSEKNILDLIALEKSSKEIAEALSVSIKTVENHRSNICKKLKITGNSALLKYALQHKSLE